MNVLSIIMCLFSSISLLIFSVLWELCRGWKIDENSMGFYVTEACLFIASIIFVSASAYIKDKAEKNKE